MANQSTDAFIRQHAGEDVRQLALRGTKDPEVDLSYALDQIAGRQKARTKLPSWAKIAEIVYPPHLSMEQCSSEYTAWYKKKIVERLTGKRQLFVDLTGGFGVDFAFIATLFQQAVYVERQEALCSLSSHNFRVLGLTQAQTRCGDGMDYLTTVSHADVIMIDPARRDEHGGRTFAITDCTPNILESLNQLLEKSHYTLVKLSPMLDWQKAVEDIGEQWVREVHIVSVGNECKELLLVLSKQVSSLKVFCVNDEDCFEYMYHHDTSDDVVVASLGGRYLYEPNASIMKGGCFQQIEQQFPVRQLAPNSHLFLSDEKLAHFPGRAFEVLDTTSMNKRELKEKLQPMRQANIAVRNFPLSVAELRKRLRITDGGEDFLFASTTAEKTHIIFICRKIH